MSSKKRTKSNKKISEPKIIYDDQIEQIPSTISTNIEGTSEKVVLDDSGSDTVEVISKTVKENTVKEIPQEVKTKKCPFSDAFLYRTLVSVKILGDKNNSRNGTHHMCFINIAKAVATNNDKYRVILVTPKTAEAICSLILDYPNVLGIDSLSESYRKTIVDRFKNDLKRFKF